MKMIVKICKGGKFKIILKLIDIVHLKIALITLIIFKNWNKNYLNLQLGIQQLNHKIVI